MERYASRIVRLEEGKILTSEELLQQAREANDRFAQATERIYQGTPAIPDFCRTIKEYFRR